MSSGTVRKYLLYVLACNLLLLCALLLLYYSPAINVNVYIDNYFMNGKLQSSSAFTIVERPGQKPHVMDLILRRPDAAKLQRPDLKLNSVHAPYPQPNPHPMPPPLSGAQGQGQAQPQAKAPETWAAPKSGMVGGQAQSWGQQKKAPAGSPAKKSASETWAIELELQIK